MHGIVLRLNTYPYLFIICVFFSFWLSFDTVVCFCFYSFLFRLYFVCIDGVSALFGTHSTLNKTTHTPRLLPLEIAGSTPANNNVNSNVSSTRLHC